MVTTGSTLRGGPNTRASELRRLAVRVFGTEQPELSSPDELAVLLLPMVTRAVRTERGPSALVRWLSPHAGRAPAASGANPATRVLTEELVRALFKPLGSPDDTLDDA